MASRTRQELYADLKYSFGQLQPRLYSKLPKPTDGYRAFLLTVAEVMGGKTDLTAHELNVLTIFEPNAKANGIDDRDIAEYAKYVLPVLREIRGLSAEKGPSADDIADEAARREQLRETLQVISAELQDLTRGFFFTDYATIARAFPTSAALVMRLSNNDHSLTLRELNMLTTLGTDIEARKVQGAKIPDFVAHYNNKVVPELQKAIALQMTYAKEEEMLAGELNKFWRKNGSEIENIYHQYKQTPPALFEQNLSRVIAVGRKLNKSHSWVSFETDIAGLHNTLLDNAGTLRPGQFTDHQVLMKTADMIEKAADARLKPTDIDHVSLTYITDDYPPQRMLNEALLAAKKIHVQIHGTAAAATP